MQIRKTTRNIVQFVQSRMIVMFLLLLNLTACSLAGARSVEPLTVSLPKLEQNALIYIAADQGYFQQNGLDVTIQDHDTGVTSLNALLQTQADLAVAAEFPVVRAVLNQEPIVILASVDKFENDFIVGRKDRGIMQTADLKGKRIGVALHTINEFYLGRFLELNGIALAEVTLVDLRPDQFVNAIADGKVDAIIAWQPYIHEIEQQVPDVMIWPAQNSQSVYGLLVCRKDWLAENPSTSQRFLKSLIAAEDYLVRQPEKARQIVQKRLGYDDAYLSSVWSQHLFSLTLDHSLIVAMTDEARWLMNNNLTVAAETPDFLSAINTQGLEAVKPEAVDIYR